MKRKWCFSLYLGERLYGFVRNQAQVAGVGVSEWLRMAVVAYGKHDVVRLRGGRRAVNGRRDSWSPSKALVELCEKLDLKEEGSSKKIFEDFAKERGVSTRAMWIKVLFDAIGVKCIPAFVIEEFQRAEDAGDPGQEKSVYLEGKKCAVVGVNQDRGASDYDENQAEVADRQEDLTPEDYRRMAELRGKGQRRKA